MMALQFLVDWCTRPHPTDQPRLKRVVGAALQAFNSESAEADFWQGILVYDGSTHRQVTGRFTGALPSGLARGHSASLVVSNTAAETAWAGLVGFGIAPSYTEDVALTDIVVGSPSTVGATLRVPGADVHYGLILWTTYLYGG